MHGKTIIWFFLIFILPCVYVVVQLTGMVMTYKINDTSMMPSYPMGTRIWASVCKKPTYNNIVCYKSTLGDSKNIGIHRLAGLEGDTIEINDGYLLRNGLIADRPGEKMFTYYAKKWAIYDMKILNNLRIKPILLKDSVILNLTSFEFKELSRIALLHKINKQKTQKEPFIAGSTELNFWNASNYGPLVIPKGYCFVLGDNRNASKDSRYLGLIPLKNIKATVICEK